MRAYAAPDTQALRGWQRRALVRYLAAAPRDFLAVATPGSGQDGVCPARRRRAAGRGRRRPDHRRRADRTPQDPVGAGRRAVGIALDPKFSNSSAQTSSEYHGVVVTYAQVASHPTRHRVRTENHRTLVVFDEIHHGGDAKSWGEAIREAFGDATRRLALTGTPFRSDDSPIPFVNYEPDGDGPDALAGRPHLRLRRRAGRRRGPAGGVHGLLGRGAVARQRGRGTRRAAGRAAQRRADRTGLAHRAQPGRRMDARGDRGRRHPAAAEAPARARRRRHDHRLRPDRRPRLRRAADHAHRRGAHPRALRRPGLLRPHLRHSRQGTSRWLVAVRMVSEGVDVPRLAVGVYATSASTPLFFAQAIGRFVRSRRPGETASIFLPSVPNLLHPGQRDGGPAQPRARQAAPRVRWADDELIADAASRRRVRPTWTTASSMLGADAELDQVIFDGSSFGTATPAGSEEEADYLGIPGLLDAEQMRDLLRRRQEEQLDRRSRAAGDIRTRRALARRNTGSCANSAANSTRWCRSPITAPGSRTAGSTTSCAGSAAARRWRRRRRTS